MKSVLFFIAMMSASLIFADKSEINDDNLVIKSDDECFDNCLYKDNFVIKNEAKTLNHLLLSVNTVFDSVVAYIDSENKSTFLGVEIKKLIDQEVNSPRVSLPELKDFIRCAEKVVSCDVQVLSETQKKTLQGDLQVKYDALMVVLEEILSKM